jgi:hypothetical protein
VLPGVSVRKVGANVNVLRRGTQGAAQRAYGVVPSMRHPSPDYPRACPAAGADQTDADTDTREVGGTGRSLRRAGVPCHVLAKVSGRLAEDCKPAAAAYWRLLQTRCTATVGESFPGCPTGLRSSATR